MSDLNISFLTLYFCYEDLESLQYNVTVILNEIVLNLWQGSLISGCL